MYVQGDRAVVARNAPSYLPPIWTIADELNRLPNGFVLNDAVLMAETGRAVAAFALESARALETQDVPTVCRLVRTVRNRWVPAGTEFARRWHAAAVAILLRSDCAAALDEEVTAALDGFPTEPRFRLVRAIAAEQRLTTDISEGHRPSARELRDGETRFKIAMALPPVAAEAALRWARVNALLGQHEQAVALSSAATASPDQRLRYLAHLFRGWSLAALGKADEADVEYSKALETVPNAQTATLARAAAAFHERQAERAEKLVGDLASRSEPADDPWWTYSIADGRHVDRLILELRQVIPQVNR